MRGAEYDSSERDPPPKCHPGTRRKIIERIQSWFRNPFRTRRLLWLVGPAGVGKSAIMQTLAEIEAQRSMISTLFLSATQRRTDPAKVIVTIAYRIAVRYPPYHKFFRTALAADPKLIEKSIKTQFSAFFVLPFVKMKLYSGSSPLIIFIDGLDECDGREEQLLFLALISCFTKFYPEAPLLWVIASRPEEHITTFLARRRLESCHDKEEVSVDSTEAFEKVRLAVVDTLQYYSLPVTLERFEPDALDAHPVEFDSKEEDVNIQCLLNMELERAIALDDCIVAATDALVSYDKAFQVVLATWVWAGGMPVWQTCQASGRVTAPDVELHAIQMGVFAACV
ncbi:hypothetical protein AN958_11539 [Leucoagaricus sp. SymC.cos]|nr:hypothetical protein AN958_11539 [Leucoagaricus sp. SymC.cos]